MSELIQSHLDSLTGWFRRINPPVDLNPLEALHNRRDLAGMTQWIRDFMALDFNIGLKITGSGEPATEQAPLWLDAPHPIPRIGTPESTSSHVNICVHAGTIENLPFELIVAAIAQVLAKLVLHSIQHPLQRDGKAVDLTAMIFGFRNFGEVEIGIDAKDLMEMLDSSGLSLPGLVYFGFLTGPESIFAQRWLSSNRERVARENMPVLDLALRLKTLQHVDDAIGLINKLGGSVTIENRGRIFKKEIQKITLEGKTYEFNSSYEMTQWVIANAVGMVKNENSPHPISNSILRGRS